MRFMQMSKQALHSISDKELRSERARLEKLGSERLHHVAHAVNRNELKIVNAEIKRRPMIPEDVFNE